MCRAKLIENLLPKQADEQSDSNPADASACVRARPLGGSSPVQLREAWSGETVSRMTGINWAPVENIELARRRQPVAKVSRCTESPCKQIEANLSLDNMAQALAPPPPPLPLRPATFYRDNFLIITK